MQWKRNETTIKQRQFYNASVEEQYWLETYSRQFCITRKVKTMKQHSSFYTVNTLDKAMNKAWRQVEPSLQDAERHFPLQKKKIFK